MTWKTFVRNAAIGSVAIGAVGLAGCSRPSYLLAGADPADPSVPGGCSGLSIDGRSLYDAASHGAPVVARAKRTGRSGAQVWSLGARDVQTI